MKYSSSDTRRQFLKTVCILSAVSATPVGLKRAFGNRPLSEKPSLRFAIASDGHFGQPRTDYVRFHNEIIEWLNFEGRNRGLDFVVFNGDLIHDKPVFLPQVKEYYDRLEMPYFTTKGNHDQVSSEVWRETWGYGQNHSFEMKDCGFLLGTTSNQKGEYLCVDVDWLKQELERHSSKEKLFAFFHISQHKFTRHGVACPEVNRLLEEASNVTAVFHGHDHDIDNVIYSNNRAYFFDGHVGGSWGTNYRGYRIVEISGNGEVATYQCNPGAYFVNQNRLG